MTIAAMVERKLNTPATLHTVRTADDADRDDMNRPIPVEADTDVLTWLHPTEATENPDEVTRSDCTAYFLADVDIAATDRLTVLGSTFEVFGEPEKWPEPKTGDIAYQVVYLVRTA